MNICLCGMVALCKKDGKGEEGGGNEVMGGGEWGCISCGHFQGRPALTWLLMVEFLGN